MNGLDIFELSYTIPSLALYLYFTPKLGYRIYKKESAYSHIFYKLIFCKCIVDLMLQTSSISFAKSTRWPFMQGFLIQHDYVCRIFYFTSSFCYTVTIGIMTIMSFNRFVAVRHPLKYKKVFTERKNCLAFVITLIVGLFIGTYSSTLSCTYIYNVLIGHIYISYTTDTMAYFLSAYTFGLYLPLMIISLILNILTVIKLKYMLSKKNSSSKADINLFTYTIMNFLVLSLLFSVYVLKAMSVFADYKQLAITGNMFMPFVVDLETFGLFFLSLGTKYVNNILVIYFISFSPQLLKIFYSKEHNKINVVTSQPKLSNVGRSGM
uniref:Serpentine receptor class gamma n=1 Tax=Parastrongyloides trichosuri TaxID=131310 RepID=A0A0N4ZM48_PARTI